MSRNFREFFFIKHFKLENVARGQTFLWAGAFPPTPRTISEFTTRLIPQAPNSQMTEHAKAAVVAAKMLNRSVVMFTH